MRVLLLLLFARKGEKIISSTCFLKWVLHINILAAYLNNWLLSALIEVQGEKALLAALFIGQQTVCWSYQLWCGLFFICPRNSALSWSRLETQGLKYRLFLKSTFYELTQPCQNPAGEQFETLPTVYTIFIKRLDAIKYTSLNYSRES